MFFSSLTHLRHRRRVLAGMGVVAAVAAVPTFAPSSNSRAWNQVAEWLKDDRAEKARAVWSKPTKAIVITGGGVLSAPATPPS